MSVATQGLAWAGRATQTAVPMPGQGRACRRCVRTRWHLATSQPRTRPPLPGAGDEIAQTHYGNNNWYGHDNQIGHMHWEGLEQPERAAFLRFCSELIALRKACPMLGRAEFLG